MFNQENHFLFIEMLIHHFTTNELIDIFITKLGNWNMIEQILSNDYLWKWKCKQTFHSELFFNKFIEHEFHFERILQKEQEIISQNLKDYNTNYGNKFYEMDYLHFVKKQFKCLEFGFLVENCHYKVNNNVYKNIKISKYFLIVSFQIENNLQNYLPSNLQNTLQNTLQNKENQFYLFIENDCYYSSNKAERKIFIYPNDFKEIMNYINYFYFNNDRGYYNFSSKSCLEKEFELKMGKNKPIDYWTQFTLKRYLKSLDYFGSVSIYLKERLDESVNEVLNVDTLQGYLQNDKLNEGKVSQYLNKFPLKSEVEHMYKIDFTKFDIYFEEGEIEKLKIVCNYFWNNFIEKELKKKNKKQLFKNINYLFQKYLNLIIIFQYQIILSMKGKEYTKFSIHKVYKNSCSTLFFVFGIYLLPIVKKLIIYRIETFINKQNDNKKLLGELNKEMQEIANNLLIYNVPKFY